MASRKDIEAGKAHVTLYANTSPLIKGLRSVQGHMNAFGASLVRTGAGIFGVGAGIVGAFAGATAAFTKMGSELDDIAQRTGTTAQNIAELKYAAEQSGSGIEALERALIAMARKGFDPDQFDQYAAEIAAIPDDVQRMQRAMEVFGKGGAELLPMLATVKELRQNARDLGLVPTDQAVKDAALVGDLFDQLQSVGMAAIFAIGAAVAPVAIEILTMIRTIVVGFNKWAQENGEILRMILMIGAGIAAAGAAVVVVGTAFIAIGAVLGGIATVLTTIGSVIAFLATPVGWVVAGVVILGAAIAGLAIYWVGFTDAGRGAAAAVMTYFKPLIAFFGDLFAGITDALAAGDIGLAAEVGVAAIMVAYRKGLLMLMQLWEGFKVWMVSLFADMFAGIFEMLASFQASLVTGINDIRKELGFGDIKGFSEIDMMAKLQRENANAWVAGAEQSKDKNLKPFEFGLEQAARRLDTAVSGAARAAAAARAASEVDDGNSGQYSTSGFGGGGMEKMKSIGGFDANALLMQGWGGGAQDPQAKIAKLMADAIKSGEANTEKIVQAIEENAAAYGT